MDYSKCWLDYQPVDTVEKEWLTYFQSCEGGNRRKCCQ